MPVKFKNVKLESIENDSNRSREREIKTGEASAIDEFVLVENRAIEGELLWRAQAPARQASQLMTR